MSQFPPAPLRVRWAAAVLHPEIIALSHTKYETGRQWDHFHSLWSDPAGDQSKLQHSFIDSVNHQNMEPKALFGQAQIRYFQFSAAIFHVTVLVSVRSEINEKSPTFIG